ncbi:ubiquitin-conjugating enzyme/RWD-like protein [Ilyonectria sp. MPI-CAGE-AT-0026]|nr:ubiquitin-conjugating enzyme/RWD-like protein [Ilyonectria sp. MPI-CAGE-AT-0026]
MIFRERFESFKARIRKNQKTKSTWTVTRWAIHDSARFRATIGNIKDLMDGLESITSSLGVLERQQALLTEEVESISDTRSLRLLQEIASSHETSPSLRIVSDAASIRLSITDGSLSSQSYYTAPSHQVERSSLRVLGEAPSGLDSTDDSRRPPLARTNFRRPFQRRSGIGAGQQNPPPVIIAQPHLERKAYRRERRELEASPSVEDVPHNQRLIASLISKAPMPNTGLMFDSGSLHYGEALATVKHLDGETWKQKSTSLLVSADKDLSAARRVFVELRSIRNACVPFVSAAPVGDSLDKVLASIGGPPDTPYEGGIFWINVKFPEAPTKPPVLRFQTKIYHPNIDSNGSICADYQAWWNVPNLQSYMFSMADRSKGSWFSESSSSRYSLGSLLTALCGLLACPNVEDPLVREIAATYITDYETYCKTATSYTAKYATARKPCTESMDFGDSVSWAGVQAGRQNTYTLDPRTQDTSSMMSTTSTEHDNNDEADLDGASLKTTSQRSFLPPGEGQEMRIKTPIPLNWIDATDGGRRHLKRSPPKAGGRWTSFIPT